MFKAQPPPFRLSMAAPQSDALRTCIFDAEVCAKAKLLLLMGITNRFSYRKYVMAQVDIHSRNQVMHCLFPTYVLDTVLDAMIEQEKLSLECWITKPVARRLIC